MPASSIVKLLEEAQRDAHTAGTSLRLANAEANSVTSILLLRLIEDARTLEDRICGLKAAIRDDEREAKPTQAGAEALRAAVEDVLQGSRMDAVGNRRDDGMQDHREDAASEFQVRAWEKRLQAALDGKAPEIRR